MIHSYCTQSDAFVDDDDFYIRYVFTRTPNFNAAPERTQAKMVEATRKLWEIIYILTRPGENVDSA
ncbi:hypothetical protein AVO42_10260 [Thiomicrospira sp. XS5]|uniref:hypothetical protein n=1 Tax=Thiomicrospira sp. XS5 TaxID=1775636 RepID=UPI000746EFB7|nr:hypothetical protein [Thiomicrospira sp. XS5]KUJ75671.1 hypothetical protein AVO42_10260 [Thiomicrospira sp. XS5]